MINEAQRKLLHHFIGTDGIYFETIKDSTSVNLGTKVLYLERAISQDCQTFLQSLDKLYDPALTGQAKIDHLDFIRALKFINDACFNNEVKYGEYGNRKALSHYFSTLDVDNAVIDTIAFQAATRKAVNDSVVVLQSNQIDIIAQKAERIMREQATTNQTGWRSELDLPQDQLALDLPQDQLAMAASYAPLHQPQFFRAMQQPQPQPTVLIVPTRVQILVQMSLITQEAVNGLSFEQLKILDYTQPLISAGYMAVDEALALTGIQLLRLGEERIVTLIQEERLIIEQAKNFSREELERVNCTQPLISAGYMTVDEALALTGIQHLSLGEERIVTLIQEGRLTIEQAKNFSDEELERVNCTQPLISAGYMAVDEALALTGIQHLRLGKERIVTLIQEGRLTIEQAKNFSDEELERVNCTQPLISAGYMPVDEALALTGIQHLRLGKERIVTLIQEERLIIEQAKNFSHEELERVNCTQPLISAGYMAVDEALALTGIQHLRLGEERIVTLIQEGRLTIEQARGLSLNQIDNINTGNEEFVLQQLNQPPAFSP